MLSLLLLYLAINYFLIFYVYILYCTGLLTNTNMHLGLSSVCIYRCDVVVTTELQECIDRTGRPTLHISE